MRDDLLVIGGVAVAVVAVLAWLKGKVAAGAVNPANPDNVVNSAVNSVVQQATGDPNQTLVGWFDDLFGINQGLAPGEKVVNGAIVAAAPDVVAVAGP